MNFLLNHLPLLMGSAVIVGTLILMVRSMRLQKEGLDRQKNGLNRVDESMKKQEEALAIARESLERTKVDAEIRRQMLDELRAIKELLGKNT